MLVFKSSYIKVRPVSSVNCMLLQALSIALFIQFCSVSHGCFPYSLISPRAPKCLEPALIVTVAVVLGLLIIISFIQTFVVIDLKKKK